MKTTRREIMTAAASAAIPALASAQSAVAVSAFTLPALPYATDALEPYIDAATMQLHHDKHHQAYVDNLNKAIGGDSTLAKLSVEELLRRLDTLPAAVRTQVRNHGGGHDGADGRACIEQPRRQRSLSLRKPLADRLDCGREISALRKT